MLHPRHSHASHLPPAHLMGSGEWGQWHELLNGYEQICRRTSQQILASGRVQKYFYLSLGMSRSTFERRMRQHDWRPQELRVLMKLLGGGENP